MTLCSNCHKTIVGVQDHNENGFPICINCSIIRDKRAVAAYEQGQAFCAAGPWTKRIDENGKIIESADLPEKKENVRYLVQFSNDEVDVYQVLADTETGELVYVEPYRGIVNEDYLRKRLKAFAKISGGK